MTNELTYYILIVRKMLLGVIGNTLGFEPRESWFEPRRGNSHKSISKPHRQNQRSPMRLTDINALVEKMNSVGDRKFTRGHEFGRGPFIQEVTLWDKKKLVPMSEWVYLDFDNPRERSLDLWFVDTEEEVFEYFDLEYPEEE